MTPETIQRILDHSCVAMLPPDVVQQTIETGAPLMPLRPEFSALHLTGMGTGCEQEETIKVAAWGQMAKRWPARSALRVRFLNGDASQRNKALARMRAIDTLCGLSFVHVTKGPSEIRILFNPSAGHWSYLGTDCRFIAQHNQTMNIGLLARDSDKEWDRVVLHETLHAVAFNHEHQHPRGTIKWNTEAVYDFYGETQGWSRAEIDAQVLRRSTATNIFGSAPDRTSIMMYPIPKELLLDPKQAVGWNTKLSALDIDILRRTYP